MNDRESIDDLIRRLDRIARDHNGYEYGLPIELEPQRAQLRETVREWLAERANREDDQHGASRVGSIR